MERAIGAVMLLVAAIAAALAQFQLLGWVYEGLRRYGYGLMADALASPLLVLATAFVGFGLIADDWRRRRRAARQPGYSPPVGSQPVPYHQHGDVEALRVLFLTYAESAYQLADRLLGRITEQLMNQKRPGASEANRSSGVLVERSIRDVARSSVALLRQRLKEQDRAGLEAAFGAFYRQYQGMSSWIHQGSQLIAFQVENDPQYLDWRERDAEFLRRLNELSAGTGYEALRSAVVGVGWGEAVRPKARPVLSENPPVPRPSLRVFGGDTVVVELSNDGGGDQFNATGQIVSASWEHKKRHPFDLAWDNLLRGEPIRRGKSGRIKLAEYRTINHQHYFLIHGEHGVVAEWPIGGMYRGDESITIVLKVELVASSNPDVQIIRHYQLEADSRDSEIRVTSWVPF